MGLEKVKQALLTVTNKVYHYTAPQAVAGAYIVWAEDGQGDSAWADGVMTAQAIEGAIDYYTPTEYDGAVTDIQGALGAAGISWRLNSVQHEDETGLIHYEWIFQTDGW